MTRIAIVVCALSLASGCRQDMQDQPRYRPLSYSNFFADHRSGRPMVADTVARGQLRTDTKLYAGKSGKDYIDTIPFPVTKDVLLRGRERFNIFCSPCHGGVGNGEGMVVQRGFRQPPSYHIDRLKNAPVGYFFDVATNGFGAMPAYGYRVPVSDRWAIIAYIRALQLSQSATLADVPPDKRRLLEQIP